jgi:hypothetical protein
MNIYDVVEAVRATLQDVPGMVRAQGNETLTDNIPETPLLQVYPEEGNQDFTTRTDRTTFGGGVQQERLVINVDVYAAQRVNIGEDYAALAHMLDAVRARLKAQKHKPYFGLDGLATFKFTWKRVTFVYGQQEERYAGYQLRLEFTLG